MFEFDLQRFDEESSEQPESTQSESLSEEQEPIPEELSGLPEDIARETMTEWKQSQTAVEPQPEEPQVEETPTEEPQESKPQTQESVPYARFKEKVDEVNQLKAKLAEYQRRLQEQQQQPQTQQKQPSQQSQSPQFKITPEISAKINEAIKAEAMTLTGMNEDDVASLQYADDDDPRIAQWQQAKSIAQNRVYNAIQQEQAERLRQAQQSYNEHRAAIDIYNQFAQKEMAEPDFGAIQNFATTEFFEQLSPNEKQIVANSYLHIERQIASPAEMLVVKNYYERAKAAYRTRGAKNPTPKPVQPTPRLPRTDQLKGSSGASDRQLSTHEIEKILEGDFTELDPKMQKMLLGLS